MFNSHAIQKGKEIIYNIYLCLCFVVQPNLNPLWHMRGWKPVERVGPERADITSDDVFDIVEQGHARWVTLLSVSFGIRVAFDLLFVKGFLFIRNEDGGFRDPAFGMNVKKPDALAFVFETIDGEFSVIG